MNMLITACFGGFLAFALLLVLIVAARDTFCRNKTAQRKILLGAWPSEAWLIAHQNRLDWKASHPYSFEFSNEEYQSLWDLEIGIEVDHRLRVGGNFSQSWHEFCGEREKAILEGLGLE
jgi:hypothetical protein